MMYRLRRNDADCLAINDVTHFVRNDAMFALMCPQAHIISTSDIIGEANIICPKGQTSLKKRLVETSRFFWRRHPDSDWGIKVLQTSALPLGYGAVCTCTAFQNASRILPHFLSFVNLYFPTFSTFPKIFPLLLFSLKNGILSLQSLYESFPYHIYAQKKAVIP